MRTKCFYHRKPVVICRHTDKVDGVQCAATFVCFQEIKVFADKQTIYKYAVTIKFGAVQYTTLE